MPVTGGTRRWHAELAWLPGQGVRPDVLIEAAGQHFTAVTPGVRPSDCPPGTARLAGLTLPGLANAHSHAFHRAPSPSPNRSWTPDSGSGTPSADSPPAR